MRIAILGGAGQIGLHLVRHLNALSGLEAVAVCRSPLIAAPLQAAEIACRVYDTNTPNSIADALTGCDAVIDTTFAPIANLRKLDTVRAFYKAVLQVPTVKHLIHLSSVAVYGELSAGYSPFGRPSPDTIYGRQKLAIESLVGETGTAATVPVLAVRLGHVYGPEMAWSLNWIQAIKNQELPKLHLAKPSNAVHVSQVCRALEEALQTRQQGTTNLVGNPNLPWSEVFDWHARVIRPTDQSTNENSFRLYRTDSERYQPGALALARDVTRSLKGSLLAGVTSNPRIAHLIRTSLALLPYAPSVDALKASVGAPVLEAYMSSTGAGEAGCLYDSAAVQGPNLLTTPIAKSEASQLFENWYDEAARPDFAAAYIRQSATRVS